MSNDTTASLLAQAQEIHRTKGSRPCAIFLAGRCVRNTMGLSLEDLPDSMLLAEALDDMQARLEAEPLTKGNIKAFMAYADTRLSCYMDEVREELEIMAEEFRRDMGLE